ncbi:hypothetical protein VTN02DRAFT_6226 [Thermoascus thermophilus]
MAFFRVCEATQSAPSDVASELMAGRGWREPALRECASESVPLVSTARTWMFRSPLRLRGGFAWRCFSRPSMMPLNRPPPPTLQMITSAGNGGAVVSPGSRGGSCSTSSGIMLPTPSQILGWSKGGMYTFLTSRPARTLTSASLPSSSPGWSMNVFRR